MTSRSNVRESRWAHAPGHRILRVKGYGCPYPWEENAVWQININQLATSRNNCCIWENVENKWEFMMSNINPMITKSSGKNMRNCILIHQTCLVPPFKTNQFVELIRHLFFVHLWGVASPYDRSLFC